jgi:hypothetical protein
VANFRPAIPCAFTHRLAAFAALLRSENLKLGLPHVTARRIPGGASLRHGAELQPGLLQSLQKVFHGTFIREPLLDIVTDMAAEGQHCNPEALRQRL